jgi:hypothetical protein
MENLIAELNLSDISEVVLRIESYIAANARALPLSEIRESLWKPLISSLIDAVGLSPRLRRGSLTKTPVDTVLLNSYVVFIDHKMTEQESYERCNLAMEMLRELVGTSMFEHEKYLAAVYLYSPSSVPPERVSIAELVHVIMDITRTSEPIRDEIDDDPDKELLHRPLPSDRLHRRIEFPDGKMFATRLKDVADMVTQIKLKSEPRQDFSVIHKLPGLGKLRARAPPMREKELFEYVEKLVEGANDLRGEKDSKDGETFDKTPAVEEASAADQSPYDVGSSDFRFQALVDRVRTNIVLVNIVHNVKDKRSMVLYHPELVHTYEKMASSPLDLDYFTVTSLIEDLSPNVVGPEVVHGEKEKAIKRLETVEPYKVYYTPKGKKSIVVLKYPSISPSYLVLGKKDDDGWNPLLASGVPSKRKKKDVSQKDEISKDKQHIVDPLLPSELLEVEMELPRPIYDRCMTIMEVKLHRAFLDKYLSPKFDLTHIESLRTIYDKILTKIGGSGADVREVSDEIVGMIQTYVDWSKMSTPEKANTKFAMSSFLSSLIGYQDDDGDIGNPDKAIMEAFENIFEMSLRRAGRPVGVE